jgi:CRISPR/Cas system-associated exonuclease Cas4 (RecB family)
MPRVLVTADSGRVLVESRVEGEKRPADIKPLPPHTTPRFLAPMRRLFVSPHAARRRAQAAGWLIAQPRGVELQLVGATNEGVVELSREAARTAKASFGWHRTTLGRLAAELALPAMAARGLAPAGALALEALCARVVEALRVKNALGRFQPVATLPGLPRAIARTISELRLAGLAPDATSDPDLARVHAAYAKELELDKLADRAAVLALATAALETGAPKAERPILFFDPIVQHPRERDFVRALALKSRDTFATLPSGDDRAIQFVAAALEVEAERDDAPATTTLERLQRYLFEATPPSRELGREVTVLSAPGESRECVEIVRRIHAEAAKGTRFDRIAILLRTPEQYRAHLEEALRRAKIPAHFARGTVLPDPAGRAFLALLSCAEELLSARRFAEYLSLAQVPDAAMGGGPPLAKPSEERWVPPDEELIPERIARALEPSVPTPEVEPEPVPASVRAPVREGSLRAPRQWERLLVESAVIGGRERWSTRLGGLREELAVRKKEAELAGLPTEALRTSIEDLAAFEGFAMPLLDELDSLARDPFAAPSSGSGPASRALRQATWGAWTEALSALATRALRKPDRVLAVLSEMAPMRDVGPLTLAEVRLVLMPRLTELVVPPPPRPPGRIYVGAALDARGLAFDVVFVPGLAERLFPQKVIEDPILRDDERARLGLATQDDRVTNERLALRLAIGSATERVVLSYPRVDMDQSRPRVPSFYGLEVLRAVEGKLPGFDELARRAEQGGAARIGWPAPRSPEQAIDEAEHDLSMLDQLLHRPEHETVGTAHYLLQHPHLARALRFRGRRWNVRDWKGADGLVHDPKEPMHPEGRAALDRHLLTARSFSPTALQQFAACPYKFVLYTIHKLSRREEPAAIEEIDPLAKGSLVHDVLFELNTRLAKASLLPVTPARLERVRAELDDVLAKVSNEYKERLCPAIDQVWRDAIDAIRADLREMLRRGSEDGAWVPYRFELSFGLDTQADRDEASVKDPVVLDCGVKLRGSIDLVEKSPAGTLRASDYKTGKQRVVPGEIISGGQALQPVFYALVLEKLLPNARVEGGRLYYSTSAGGFSDVFIPLDVEARAAAEVVAEVVGGALTDGFFPAAPEEDGCMWCDFRVVCGPYEDQRTRKKKKERLAPLLRLRAVK